MCIRDRCWVCLALVGRWIKKGIKRAVRRGSVIGKRKKRNIINKAKRKAGDISEKARKTKPVRKAIKKIGDFDLYDTADKAIQKTGIRKAIKKIGDFDLYDTADKAIQKTRIRKVLNPKYRKKKVTKSKRRKPKNWVR